MSSWSLHERRIIQVKVNCAGILGVLGSHPSHTPHNYVVGSTLICLLEQCADLARVNLDAAGALAAEAVFALVDIYAEDDAHLQNMDQLSLLSKLAVFLPQLRSFAKFGVKVLDPPLLERLAEAAENLEQFIAHKLGRP
jgi:hypothetical protein